MERSVTYEDRIAALPVQAGDLVMIPKGVSVLSLNPSKGRYQTRRATSVTVNEVFPGYRTNMEFKPATIRWAGSGGYWCECDLDDVQKRERA
jgi:hypothetical protein